MTKAIESIKAHEEERQLAALANYQAAFLHRYTELLPDDRSKYEFERELMYLINLTYREAQQPLVKQLTDFVMTQNRPIVLGEL